MSIIRSLLLGVSILFSVSICSLSAASASILGSTRGPESFADIVEEVTPAVVNISTTTVVKRSHDNFSFSQLEDFFNHTFPFLERDPMMDEGAVPKVARYSCGSGFIIDEDGHIVTNFHVIDEAQEIFVRFNGSKKEIKAKVIGVDVRTDLALLKVDLDYKLPYLRFGDPEKSRVGDWVLAIGNPFDLGGTVTSGIISAKARSLQNGYNDLIQTDASINMGNSGGPMISMSSEVIGVNRAIFSQTGGNIGIGFATSANTVKYVVNSIKEHGHVLRPWFGFIFQPIDVKMLEAIDYADTDGIIVSRVLPNSPAHKAGFMAGDIVTHINDEAVNLTNLYSVLLNKKIGEKVALSILRDGKKIIIEATPTNEPDDKGIAQLMQGGTKPINDEDGKHDKSDYRYGIKVMEIEPNLRAKYKVTDDINGVAIEGVSRGSVAHFAGLKPGMIIISVNNQPTITIKDFYDACERVQGDNKKSALLLVYYDGVTQFIVMREK